MPTRTDLRTAERHASWREVYHALGVDPDQHAEQDEARDDE